MTTTTSPYVSSAALPTPRDNVLFYQRAAINRINVTPATATDIGYLSKNKTQLEVVSELTPQDKVNMFKFTAQSTAGVGLTLKNINGKTSVHVQLMDSMGVRVLADNQSRDKKLTDAYKKLTTSTNLNLAAGQYIVKVTYGQGADKTKKQDYTIQLDSGTTYKADYRTLGSPTTVSRTLMTGGSLGYNASSASASVISNVIMNYGTPDASSPVDIFTTGILA